LKNFGIFSDLRMALAEFQERLSVGPTNGLETCPLAPGGEDEWDRFVLDSPSGTFFHLSGWRTVVERVLGRRTYSFTARDSRGIRGVFPIGYVRSRLFGNSLVSFPLAVYGGICADDAPAYAGLLKAGQALADQLGVKYLEMRNRTEPCPSDLPGRDLYVTFTQDLSAGPEKLMQALPRDTRYAIRKSIKSGLQWMEEVTLAEFYEIYAQSVHRLGTPVFSRNLFEILRSVFPRHTRLFGVRKDKDLIAAVFCLYFRDQVLPYYAGALPEFYEDAPNNFMYWRLIAQSCAEGYRLFDFGRSKRETGSFRFKSAWSMKVSALPYRYYLVRAKEVPHMSPVDQKFQLPVRLWKQLPFGLTKILGPSLIRRIPSV
jgi:FemAB-related protein (PEP-CTERM system-associated)